MLTIDYIVETKKEGEWVSWGIVYDSLHTARRIGGYLKDRGWETRLLKRTVLNVKRMVQVE